MHSPSSTVRLSAQLKAVVGSVDLTFRGARLDIPSVGEIDNIWCKAIVDKQGSSITRKSSVRSYVSYPQWNEVARFQACSDWTLEFVIVVELQDGRAMQLTSDLSAVNSSGAYNIPIRLGARCVGELEISIAFHPNYYSFKYLAIGCTLSEQLPYSLTKSILTDLNTTSAEESMYAMASEEDILCIFAAVENFTTFLTQEDVYNGELCLALHIKTTYDGRINKPPNERDPHHYKSLLSEQQFSVPREVPLPRVAAGAKNFLTKLLEELSQVYLCVYLRGCLMENSLSYYCSLLLFSPATTNLARFN